MIFLRFVIDLGKFRILWYGKALLDKLNTSNFLSFPIEAGSWVKGIWLRYSKTSSSKLLNLGEIELILFPPNTNTFNFLQPHTASGTCVKLLDIRLRESIFGGRNRHLSSRRFPTQLNTESFFNPFIVAGIFVKLLKPMFKEVKLGNEQISSGKSLN